MISSIKNKIITDDLFGLKLLMAKNTCSVCIEEKLYYINFSKCSHGICANCFLGIINSGRTIKCPECRACIF